jgi:hypothetical protein
VRKDVMGIIYNMHWGDDKCIKKLWLKNPARNQFRYLNINGRTILQYNQTAI